MKIKTNDTDSYVYCSTTLNNMIRSSEDFLENDSNETGRLIEIKEKERSVPIQSKIKTYTNAFSIILCFVVLPTFIVSLILNIIRKNNKKSIIASVIFVLSYFLSIAVPILNMLATLEQNIIFSILAMIMFLGILAIEITLIVFCFPKKNKTN